MATPALAVMLCQAAEIASPRSMRPSLVRPSTGAVMKGSGAEGVWNGFWLMAPASSHNGALRQPRTPCRAERVPTTEAR